MARPAFSAWRHITGQAWALGTGVAVEIFQGQGRVEHRLVCASSSSYTHALVSMGMGSKIPTDTKVLGCPSLIYKMV